MKKIFTLIFIAGILSACNFSVNNTKVGIRKTVKCKGEVTTLQIDGLTGFDAIVVNGAADIKFIQDDAQSVSVKANSEVFEYLDYSVSETGELLIETKDNVNIKADTYKISISAPLLKSVEINGAAEWKQKEYIAGTGLNFTVNGAADLEIKNISVPTLKMEVNGAADLEIEGVNTGSLSLTVNGAGSAELSGRADYAFFEVNGAGSIDARELVTEKVEKVKSGVASIRL